MTESNSDSECPSPLPLDAVERILAKVGERHTPSDLDKHRLANALGNCLLWHHHLIETFTDKSARARIRRLTSIIKAAKRLEKELSPDDIWNPSQDCESHYLRSGINCFLGTLSSEIDDLQWNIEWGPDWREAIRAGRLPLISWAEYWRSRSPFEWLAGYNLPSLFRKHFALPSKFHRRAADNEPDAPVIRFIEQALMEFKVTKRGKKYARDSIAKALADARSGRTRRTAARDVGQSKKKR